MVTSRIPKYELSVAEYMPVIRSVANKLMKTLPHNHEHNDLVAAGVLGLIQAFRRFDSSKGVKFITYAYYRIRGEMLDYLRKCGLKQKQFRGVHVYSLTLLVSHRNNDDLEAENCGTADISFDDVDSEDAFDFLMRGLKTRNRSIMRMYYERGLTEVEIAAKKNVSPSRISQVIKESLECIKEKS